MPRSFNILMPRSSLKTTKISAGSDQAEGPNAQGMDELRTPLAQAIPAQAILAEASWLKAVSAQTTLRCVARGSLIVKAAQLLLTPAFTRDLSNRVQLDHLDRQPVTIVATGG